MRLTPIPALESFKCRSVGAGWGHSAVVTEGGEALLFGRTHDFGNTLRILNMNRTMNWMAKAINAASDLAWKTDLSPSLLDMEDGGPTPSFAAVACSPGALTAFLAKDGKVYCVGANDFGQCGRGDKTFNVFKARAVEGLEGEAVTHVSAGFAHCLAVTASGKLYSWGKNDRGQLGCFTTDDNAMAVQVVGVDMELTGTKVVAAASGFSHSAAITEDGRAWVWGKMQAGVTRDGKVMNDQLQPRRLDLPTPSPAITVSCGQAHTCFGTADGQLWMVGLRGRGVLFDTTGAPVDEFTERVVDPSAASSGASLSQVDPVPVSVEALPHGSGTRFRQLVSGVHHAYGVDDNGSVAHWGWRLRATPYPITQAVGLPVLDMAVGFEHTLAILQE